MGVQERVWAECDPSMLSTNACPMFAFRGCVSCSNSDREPSVEIFGILVSSWMGSMFPEAALSVRGPGTLRVLHPNSLGPVEEASSSGLGPSMDFRQGYMHLVVVVSLGSADCEVVPGARKGDLPLRRAPCDPCVSSSCCSFFSVPFQTVSEADD
ncbi:hypothetical protein AV530_010608 [Patagioenas fasciata monilis]|uniref:Uncharacterized protein n=1 Tax=Patagioenas fasciata monilis TaxID=372326 RepID=A0A1V4KFH9_PATFA|nr:hypothetical protein AV530_010608 [Patagioenas fasciata monilis]